MGFKELIKKWAPYIVAAIHDTKDGAHVEKISGAVLPRKQLKAQTKKTARGDLNLVLTSAGQ